MAGDAGRSWLGVRGLAFCGTAMVLAFGVSSSLEAAPVTFRFEAVLTEIDSNNLDLFGTLSPGANIQVVFTYDDFEQFGGVILSDITVDLGTLLLLSNKYGYQRSDNGEGLFPSNPDAGDSVLLFCPGGLPSGGCDPVRIGNTNFAWDGSFSFGGSADIFADPPTAAISTPAAALHLPETWSSFDSGEFLISVTHISGLGSPAIVRGTIDVSSFAVVPEPTSLALVFCVCWLRQDVDREPVFEKLIQNQ